MQYLIDGYNLIFSLSETKEDLRALRTKLIQFLQRYFVQLKLEGIVVFDGSHRNDEESGLAYSSPLEIAYTPKGQSADEYIIEKISLDHNAREITVVSNDRGLISHVRSMEAKALSNRAFISMLEKRGEKGKKTVSEKLTVESKKDFQRLLKIFEKKFNSDESQ